MAGGQLEPGKTTERKSAKKGIHSYRLTLSAGQFLHVAVNQLEVDVAVILFGPDGKQIINIDYSDSRYRPELLRVVAEVEGNYRLEVQARQAGKYAIKIEQLRVATAQDRKQAAADLLCAEAWQLPNKASRDAIEKYDQALPLMRGLGNRKEEGFTLGLIGDKHKALGNNQTALDYYNRALAILQGTGAHWEEAFVLNNVASLYNLLGERQKALEHFNVALSLIHAIGDRRKEAVLLNNIGNLYHAQGEAQKALEHYDRALELIPNRGGYRALIFHNIAALYYSLGDLQKALEYYNENVSIARSLGGKQGHNTSLNIGVIYKSLGDLHKALKHYNLALRQSRSDGNKRLEAITLNHIGSVYESMGDSKKALEHYNLALSSIRIVGEQCREATILTNIGIVYESLGEKQKALDYYNKSLLLSRAVEVCNTESLTLYRIAYAQRGLNNLTEARSNIEAALKIVESLRTKVASYDLRASYFASVQQYYDFYIDLLMRLDQLNPNEGYREIALHGSERARARTLLEMLTEARANIHQGVEPSLLARERSLKQLIDAKRDRQARLLNGKHTQEEIEQSNKEVEQLLAQYEEAKAQIRLKSPGYAALTQPGPLTLKEIQKEVVDADTMLLEYALGEESSYLWAVTQDSMLTFELPKRAEIEKAAQRVYDLLSVNNQQKRASKFYSTYNEAVSALSDMVLGPVAAHLGKRRLLIVPHGALNYIPFTALPLPPVEKPATVNARRTAHAGLELLIAKHEIIHLPSASALAVLRRKLVGRKLPPKAVAVIADPVFNKDDVRVREAIKGKAKAIGEKRGRKDESMISSNNLSQTALLRSVKEVGLGEGMELPRLPYSGQEARAIFALAEQAGAMSAMGFDASRETATSAEIGQYRIVHFATHSLLNNEHPELSGLVLSLVDKRGEPKDGFLRLHDIYNLNLEADLVVLSACQTALGKQIKGEGLVGVTRGFMYSGAARVMASLWKVDDEATAELMERFYTEMMKEGQSPPAALRTAQLGMQKQKRWQSPYYWAGFILQGEWR